MLKLLPLLEFEHRAAVQIMLANGARTAGDLLALLIAETARLAGCETTLTLDLKPARAAGFERIAV